VSAHEEKKNYENKAHKYSICDIIHPSQKEEHRPGHKVEDNTGHKVEDNKGHKVEDNHGLVDHEIYEHGFGGIYGLHNHGDIVLEKFRRRGSSGKTSSIKIRT